MKKRTEEEGEGEGEGEREGDKGGIIMICPFEQVVDILTHVCAPCEAGPQGV